MLKIYLTSTDGSGNKERQTLHSVSNMDEALADCWAMAQANEKCVKSNGWDTNLMISSQFDWCAALQQIDKDTGETVRSYMWSYEDEDPDNRMETDDALREVIRSCNNAIGSSGKYRDEMIDEAYENMLCAHTLWEAE